MPKLTIQRDAPAKINWFLEVLRKREDGYHELLTIMQELEWCDTLTVSSRDDDQLLLTCDDPSLPTDGRNLVMKAALALRELTGTRIGASIHLQKRVPSGGGLGGGSSDAACTLLCLAELWGLDLASRPVRAQLHAVAAKLGSDINFFLEGPLAKCEGRGEIVTPLTGARAVSLVVVWPGVTVPTPIIFQSGRIQLTQKRENGNNWHSGLAGNPIHWKLFNRLEQPCLSLFPEVERAMVALRGAAGSRPVLLSGSGSCMYAACESQEAALALAKTIEQVLPPNAKATVTRTRTTTPVARRLDEGWASVHGGSRGHRSQD